MEPGGLISHYRVLEKLGEGGMGEVWKAEDTRLNRIVALKFIPAGAAGDREFRTRFRHEAQAAAALSHPNLCTIFEIDEESGFLSMEFLAGETVQARVAHRPLPLQEALDIAIQAAQGLQAAHEKEVVHRDIKGSNIMITGQGAVKILDFGLARLAGCTRVTKTGAALGTPAYMSPEQARGGEVDRRTDLWSLGVVLYEMVTGQLPFRGDGEAAVMNSILHAEPEPVTALRAGLPLELDRVIGKGLAKDAAERYQHAEDLLVDLRALARRSDPAVPQAYLRAPRRVQFWPVLAALLAAVLAVGAAMWPRAVRQPMLRLSVDLGPNAMAGSNTTVVLSPDGTRIVFPVRGPGGAPRLATRLLDQVQITILPGTENAADPFFSPDGQWVGFFSGGKMKKVSVQGDGLVTLCAAPNPQGASWGEDGNIVAALSNLSALSRIPAAGGTPELLTRLDKEESTHRWPQILPGGEAVLFAASRSIVGFDVASVQIMSLKDGRRKILQRGAYFGRYLPSGHLVYIQQDRLMAVTFDPVRLEFRGTPVPVLDDVAVNASRGAAQFDFSRTPGGTGTVAYLPAQGGGTSWPVVWLDSSGQIKPLIAAPAAYNYPQFSPDGQRMAVTISVGSSSDLYIYDLRRETQRRLTFSSQANLPVWAPDGKHLVFNDSFSGLGLYWIRADGSGESQRLLATGNNLFPYSFSPDGRLLAYIEQHPETGQDLWALPLDLNDPERPKPGRPEVLLRTPFNESIPSISPDGHWLAYRSDESGTNEIYVRPFKTAGGKWQVSSGGALYQAWSPIGRELYYETLDSRIMVVDYTVSGESFEFGKPRLWSDRQIFFPGVRNMALAPDGKRFAVFPMPEAAPDTRSIHVTFLLNYYDDLRRRVPPGR